MKIMPTVCLVFTNNWKVIAVLAAASASPVTVSTMSQFRFTSKTHDVFQPDTPTARSIQVAKCPATKSTHKHQAVVQWLMSKICWRPQLLSHLNNKNHKKFIHRMSYVCIQLHNSSQLTCCLQKATKHWLFPTTWTPSIARHFLRLILYGVLAVVFDIMPP